ncbi:MAG: hypothetical protein AAF495_14270 [Pseudomonadota bacterium]
MIKRFGIFIAAAFAVAGSGHAADPQNIHLRIENASEVSIRCVMVLAHFVTKDMPPIPSGSSYTTTLIRDPDQGTLSYGSFDDHPMMLENLLCGSLSDWTTTSRDLPILNLRSAEATRFHFQCTLQDERLACATR